MKVLILRLSSLGDVVLTIPAVNMLIDSHPDWEIDYLTHAPYVKILQAVKGLRKIYTIDKKGLGKLKRKSIAGAIELIKEIHVEEYDAVVDFHSYPETGFLASLTNAPLTIGCGPASPMLYNKHFGKYPTKQQMWRTHVQTLVASDLLDQKYLERIPEFFYLSKDEPFAEKVQKWFRDQKIDESKFKLGMFMSASRSYKCWDNESYIEFASEILKKYESIEVVVIGSLNDEDQQKEFMAQVADFFSQNEKLSQNLKFHWYSSPELLEIVEIDRKLDFFISNDTGPYHLAVMSGIQTIGLYQKPWIQFEPPPPHHVVYAPDGDLKKLKAKDVADAFNKLMS